MTKREFKSMRRAGVKKWQYGLAELEKKGIEPFVVWWENEGMKKCAFCHNFVRGTYCGQCPLTTMSNKCITEWEWLDERMVFSVPTKRKLVAACKAIKAKIQAVEWEDRFKDVQYVKTYGGRI